MQLPQSKPRTFRSWTVRRFVFIGVLSLVPLLTVHAGKEVPRAANEDVDFTALNLDELGAVNVPTVFGASKHEQKTTEAPSAVTIITQDEIKKAGHRNLEDILNSVRGFAEDGGMVGFTRDKENIRIKLNLDAAIAASLKVDSKLSSVAKLVKEGDAS